MGGRKKGESDGRSLSIATFPALGQSPHWRWSSSFPRICLRHPDSGDDNGAANNYVLTSVRQLDNLTIVIDVVRATLSFGTCDCQVSSALEATEAVGIMVAQIAIKLCFPNEVFLDSPFVVLFSIFFVFVFYLFCVRLPHHWFPPLFIRLRRCLLYRVSSMPPHFWDLVKGRFH